MGLRTWQKQIYMRTKKQLELVFCKRNGFGTTDELLTDQFLIFIMRMSHRFMDDLCTSKLYIEFIYCAPSHRQDIRSSPISPEQFLEVLILDVIESKHGVLLVFMMQQSFQPYICLFKMTNFHVCIQQTIFRFLCTRMFCEGSDLRMGCGMFLGGSIGEDDISGEDVERFAWLDLVD